MIERIILALVVLLLGAIVYRIYTRRQLHQLQNQAPTDLLTQTGVPTILYFTSPTCAVCRLQLVPRFEQLQAEMGADRLQITGIDVTENWEAAEQWHIFSVPTTILLDVTGQPVKVFQGVVELRALRDALALTKTSEP